jgi:hypothetical protein
MLHYPEHSIRKKVKPTELDDRIRLAFWNEYNRKAGKHKRMNLRNVLRNLCSKKTWNSEYKSNRYKILWIVTPPQSNEFVRKQILLRSLKGKLKAVCQPIRDKQTGGINHDVVEQILEALTGLGRFESLKFF